MIKEQGVYSFFLKGSVMRFSRIISTLLLFFLPNFLIAEFLDDLGAGAKLNFPSPFSVNWNPNGIYLAIGGSNGTIDVAVYMWNSSTSILVDLGANAKLNFGLQASSVNWSHNGKYLAIGGNNGTTDVAVYEWNSSTNSLIDLGAQAKLNFGAQANSVNWSHDDKYLAIGGVNGTTDVAVYEWNSSTNSLIDLGPQAKLDFGSYAQSVNWSPDDKYLAIGGNNGTTDVAVYEWNSSTNSLIDLGPQAKLDFGLYAFSINWSPDGKYLAIAGNNGTTNVAVYEWNNQTNALLDLGTNAKLNFGVIAESVNWSPDGNFLAIGGNNGTTDVAVYEWNSSTTSLIDLGAQAKKDFNSGAYSANWSPNQKYLVTSGSNGGTNDVAVYLTYDEYLRNLISQLEAANGSIFDFPLTSDLILQNDFHIAPGQKIEIANTLTIDGQGATIEFSNANHSQFIVRPGCIVTLKNIELDRINAKTFDLRWVSFRDPTSHLWTIQEGQINIGENVIFTLSEDVTFSQGLYNLIRKTDGDPSVFYIKDFDGKNKLIINPTDSYKTAIARASADGTLSDRLNQFNEPILIQLNENTLALQGTDLSGVEHISNTITNYVGAIGLLGGTSVSFGDPNVNISATQQRSGVKETYNMVFFVEGTGNTFILTKDGLLFTGELTFADEGENSLDITTILQEKVVNPIDDPARRIPLVNFGTGFMFLTSLTGKAILNFTDSQIRVNNAQNGFIAEENSILKGNKVEIYGDYIWDLSNPYIPDISFVSMVTELLAPDPVLGNSPILPSVIFTSPNVPNSFHGLINKHKTALHLKYQKDGALIKKDAKTKEVELPTPSRKVLSFFNIKNQELASVRGNVELDGSNATKFSISDEDVNLTIKNGSTVTLGSDEFVVVKPNDIINIVGQGNEIRIQANLYVEGQILFAPNSELKIVFLNPDANIIFTNHNYLLLEPNTKLIFDGPGVANFDDGSYIYFNGQKNILYSNPELIINNRAAFFPSTWATMQLAGVGRIAVTENGTFGVNGHQQIIIGDSSSDEIDISVVGGMIMSTGDTTGTGTISLQQGTSSLSAYSGGIISIQDQGVLEINTLNGVLAKGNFMGLLLDPHGQFALNKGGKLSFASNLNEPEISGKQYIIWKSINTIFSAAMANNAGVVEYVAGTPAAGQFNRGFTGKFQLSNALLNTGLDGLTAEQLVRTLINQLDPTIFPTATLLNDKNDKQFIRLNNGALIAAVVGDVFKSELENGSVLAINNNNNIIYALDGTRLVTT
jgi:hypothetical protein